MCGQYIDIYNPVKSLFMFVVYTVFKYIPKYYNVVKVNQSGYNACDAKNAIAVYKSGNDMVTLQSGVHYFICSVGDDCQKHGMSVVIQVL
ncbi:putative cupredoxin [Lupinus albus]|uniref:Putative cupredoxin n=1 Tax=Lupinus albus TaxID=3870 RepID=A0A6A4P7C0_LUPAL|nr:putative cupredoxin [Lupinus albus]